MNLNISEMLIAMCLVSARHILSSLFEGNHVYIWLTVFQLLRISLIFNLFFYTQVDKFLVVQTFFPVTLLDIYVWKCLILQHFYIIYFFYYFFYFATCKNLSTPSQRFLEIIQQRKTTDFSPKSMIYKEVFDL